ncbi:hypothetical protein C0989_003787 [Termitomyces sp. Mn162]|nr:hypothetical protein C0989_003787 [Termitomyces sp. Mn162]
MKSLIAPQQYEGLSGQAWRHHSKISYIEGYPDSEHLIAWDDRFSSGERFQREEQIRREVQHALAVQKLSRARKAKKSAFPSRESQADPSVECKLYDRDSLASRACARQDSYTTKVVPTSQHGNFICEIENRYFANNRNP